MYLEPNRICPAVLFFALFPVAPLDIDIPQPLLHGVLNTCFCVLVKQHTLSNPSCSMFFQARHPSETTTAESRVRGIASSHLGKVCCCVIKSAGNLRVRADEAPTGRKEAKRWIFNVQIIFSPRRIHVPIGVRCRARVICSDWNIGTCKHRTPIHVVDTLSTGKCNSRVENKRRLTPNPGTYSVIIYFTGHRKRPKRGYETKPFGLWKGRPRELRSISRQD